jgi:predicted metal-dependent hydrolase
MTAITTPASTPIAPSTSAVNAQIKPRNRSHDVSAALHGEWLDDNAFLTAFFNAMSIAFPVGEKFFIDAVRHYGDRITDPALKADIQGFCGQEGFHRREHQRYNETLCAARGYDLDKLEGTLTRRLNWARKNLSPMKNLAVTVAIEHFTAVLAEILLRDGSILDRADPSMRALWRWHAAEELEHKTVAFDVFRAVGGSEALRIGVMRRASVFLAFELTRALMTILRKDGQLFNFRLWRAGLLSLFGKQGVFGGAWGEYKAFYKKGFHPEQQDTRELLVQWAAEIQPASA